MRVTGGRARGIQLEVPKLRVRPEFQGRPFLIFSPVAAPMVWKLYAEEPIMEYS